MSFKLISKHIHEDLSLKKKIKFPDFLEYIKKYMRLNYKVYYLEDNNSKIQGYFLLKKSELNDKFFVCDIHVTNTYLHDILDIIKYVINNNIRETQYINNTETKIHELYFSRSQKIF